MQFIYVYPERNGPDGDLLDAGAVAELATAAEAAGWSGFAFTEHPIPGRAWLEAGGHQSLDPFVALGHVAAVTTRLTLLTYLAVAPYRNPSLLAKAAATVDTLSGGRFILGIGTGYQKSEFHALGVDFAERNELFDEALDVLPLHWSGEPFSYAGRHFNARDVVARTRPVQQPIPIWIGGNSNLSLRRVAQRAQGWMPMLGGPELATNTRTAPLSTTADIAAKVTRLRELAGDRAASIDVAVSYLDESIVRPGDDVERHRAAFGEIADAGGTWIIVTGRSRSPAESLEFLAAFGATYCRD